MVWLSGEQSWCYQQLLQLNEQASQVNSLLVTNKSLFESVTKIPPQSTPFSNTIVPKDCYKHLGTQHSLIIFDGYSGVNPDSLAQISGTLVGGGVFVFITPMSVKWQSWQELEQNNLWVQPFGLEDVSRHFLDWLHQCLVTDQQILRFSQEDSCNFQDSATHYFPGTKRWANDVSLKIQPPLDKLCINSSALKKQQQIVTALANYLFKEQRTCAVLTAARGRGKSAALGLLIDQLQEQTPSQIDIYLTAGDKNAVEQVRCFSSYPVSFSSLHQLLIENRYSENSLLIVDEAASISVEVLLELMNRFSHVVLSTTTQGYEGTGQGFKLRFLEQLAQRSIRYQSFSLSLPMRWAQGDPLEKWLDHLMFLEHVEDERLSHPESQDLASDGCLEGCSKKHLQVEKFTGQQLIAAPALLQSLFSLLAQAHYRTTPSDLRIILDSPNMHLWLGFGYHGEKLSLLAACLVAIEGPIASFEKDEQGMDGEELALAMFKGLRRPRGNLLPQILIGQEGYIAAKELKIARIVRIATRAGSRKQGIASELIQNVKEWAVQQGCDHLAANFSLERSLLSFWHNQQLSLVRIGSQLDPITASYSATVMMELSSKHSVLKQLRATLNDRLKFSRLRVFDSSLPVETLELIETLLQQNIEYSASKAPALPANNDFNWYLEQLACFANYHRPLASVAYIFVLLFHRYPHCWLSVNLSAHHTGLIKDYFFTKTSLADIYQHYGLANYKALQKELRLVTKDLLKAI